jgi:hypothetical protein
MRFASGPLRDNISEVVRRRLLFESRSRPWEQEGINIVLSIQ